VYYRRSSEYNLPTPAGPSLVLDSGEQALRCLISGGTPLDELALLIEMIFSSEKATGMVGCLRGSDAQIFIDVVGEVRYHSHISEE